MLVAGCATPSRVQEMIDASHRDYLDQMAAHDASIGVLKQSAMAALEQGKANEAALTELQQDMKDMLATLEVIKRNTEASKLMSAANTVKVADLEDVMTANKEDFDKFRKKVQANDSLYEEVMVAHFRALSASAAAAIQALEADNSNNSKNASVAIGAPIVITAPDTTVATNNASAQ